MISSLLISGWSLRDGKRLTQSHMVSTGRTAAHSVAHFPFTLPQPQALAVVLGEMPHLGVSGSEPRRRALCTRPVRLAICFSMASMRSLGRMVALSTPSLGSLLPSPPIPKIGN